MEKLIQSIKDLLKSLGFDLGDKEKDLTDKLNGALKDALKENSSDVALKEQLTKLETELAELKKAKPDDKTGEIAELKALVETMSTTITEMKKDRDTQKEEIDKKARADKEKKVAELKKKGIDEGRITEATWKEKWEAEANENPDKFEKLLPSLAVDPHFKKKEGGDNNNNGDNGNKYVGPLNGADKDIMKSISEMSAN